jgi:hypothetical protein
MPSNHSLLYMNEIRVNTASYPMSISSVLSVGTNWLGRETEHLYSSGALNNKGVGIAHLTN